MKISHHLVTSLNSGAVRITLSAIEVEAFKRLLYDGRRDIQAGLTENVFGHKPKTKEDISFDKKSKAAISLATAILERI